MVLAVQWLCVLGPAYGPQQRVLPCLPWLFLGFEAITRLVFDMEHVFPSQDVHSNGPCSDYTKEIRYAAFVNPVSQ